MSKEILVPDIGDFSEVDVIEILVSVGDTISVDESVITLESDKASMDVPTPEGGVVKEIKVAVGDKVSQGTLMLILEDSGEASVNVATDDAQPKARGAGESSVEDILVPDIGDFDAVDVIEVLVAVGDTVAQEDSLITLESDKASMDIPSPIAGVVKSVEVVVGDKVAKGSKILSLEIAGSGETASSEPADTKASAPQEKKAPAASAGGNAPAVDSVALKRVHASPSVRRIAREQGVDLTKLSASGPHGRVTEQDVHDYKSGSGRFAPASAGAEGGMGIPVITQPDWSKFGEVSSVAMSRIGKLSSKHLHRAWLNVPHVTHFDEADITELEAYRKQMKDKAKEMGFGFTPLVFMMKAVVAGLKEFPKFNSAMDDDGENLTQRHFYNIGIAVDTPDGLVVPVIRDVDRKGLFDLARELGEVSKRARDGQLKSADMQGGCFTISSLGGIGGTNFTPIVNAPEVGILGLTRAQTRLARKGNEIVDQLIQPLAVSYDHRVIDGAYAARFVSHLSFVLSDVRNLIL